jgi:hypothetical protein
LIGSRTPPEPPEVYAEKNLSQYYIEQKGEIMRGCFVTFFICGLLAFGTTEKSVAQTTIGGKITDAKTGKPLRGVNVFLSGTKIGTATDVLGKYQLRRIPPGGHRLVVSIIGYGRTLTEIVIGPGETREMDFELKPVVYEMPEIFVGNLDKKWERRLRRFTGLFIGESEWADSVEILNPEVLRFDTKWWGRLSAKALAPLEIENRALGYHITYHLDEFEHTGTRTRWDGEPLFTEMNPADSTQAAYWNRNRREAFYGSLRHLLLALLQDQVREEGFILNTLREGIHGYQENRFRTSAQRLINGTDENYLYHMQFYGRLEIIYTREEEDWRYVRWQHSHRGPAGSQTSYLELNERPITVDTDGEILEPYGATQFGYFAFQRLADATPREYRPEDFNIADFAPAEREENYK